MLMPFQISMFIQRGRRALRKIKLVGERNTPPTKDEKIMYCSRLIYGICCMIALHPGAVKPAIRPIAAPRIRPPAPTPTMIHVLRRATFCDKAVARLKEAAACDKELCKSVDSSADSFKLCVNDADRLPSLSSSANCRRLSSFNLCSSAFAVSKS